MNPKNRAVRAVIGIGLLCLLPASALATGQQPDVIIYKGKTYALFANPFEEFYKDQESRPLFRVKPRFGKVNEANSRPLTKFEWRDFTDLLNRKSYWALIGEMQVRPTLS